MENSHKSLLHVPQGLSTEALAQLVITVITLKEKCLQDERAKKILRDASEILLSSNDNFSRKYRNVEVQTKHSVNNKSTCNISYISPLQNLYVQNSEHNLSNSWKSSKEINYGSSTYFMNPGTNSLCTLPQTLKRKLPPLFSPKSGSSDKVTPDLTYTKQICHTSSKRQRSNSVDSANLEQCKNCSERFNTTSLFTSSDSLLNSDKNSSSNASSTMKLPNEEITHNVDQAVCDVKCDDSKSEEKLSEIPLDKRNNTPHLSVSNEVPNKSSSQHNSDMTKNRQLSPSKNVKPVPLSQPKQNLLGIKNDGFNERCPTKERCRNSMDKESYQKNYRSKFYQQEKNSTKPFSSVHNQSHHSRDIPPAFFSMSNLQRNQNVQFFPRKSILHSSHSWQQNNNTKPVSSVYNQSHHSHDIPPAFFSVSNFQQNQNVQFFPHKSILHSNHSWQQNRYTADGPYRRDLYEASFYSPWQNKPLTPNFNCWTNSFAPLSY